MLQNLIVVEQNRIKQEWSEWNERCRTLFAVTSGEARKTVARVVRQAVHAGAREPTRRQRTVVQLYTARTRQRNRRQSSSKLPPSFFQVVTQIQTTSVLLAPIKHCFAQEHVR